MLKTTPLILTQSTAVSPQKPLLERSFEKAFPPSLLLFLGGAIALIIALNIIGAKGQKNVIANARFAKPKEIKQMQKKVEKQQAHAKKNVVALRFGTDHKYGLSSMQPGIAVVGRSRVGKTASFIDPMLVDAIDRDATIFVYDAKGTHISRHLGYALSKEYFAKVFAPGKHYCREIQAKINFIDFLTDDKEGVMARELGQTTNANLMGMNTSSSPSTEYFSETGAALFEAIFMIAKQFPDPDFLTAWKILSLPDLAKRLALAANAHQVPKEVADLLFTDLMWNPKFRWALESAMGTISVADAKQTSGGIISSAVTAARRLINPAFLPHLLETNIPLDLNGRQIIFFQPDIESMDATSPLCAMALHMLVQRNLGHMNRDRPLIIFLDEFTSAAWPGLERWMALMAEMGITIILGYQSDAQTYHRYGQHKTDSIISNAGSKVYFDPGHIETAQKLSTRLGQKEVKYYENSGGKRHAHRTKVSLLTPDEILSPEHMGVGDAIIFGPDIARPWKLKVRYSESDHIVQNYHRSEQVWKSRLSIPTPRSLMSPEEVTIEKDNRGVLAAGFLPSHSDLNNVQEMLKMEREARKQSEKDKKEGESTAPEIKPIEKEIENVVT